MNELKGNRMKKKLLWILLLGACLALFGCGNDRLESTPAPVATTMAAPEQTEKVTDERKEAWEKASQWLKGYYEKEVTTDQYSEDKVEKESDGYIITMKVYLEAAGKVEVKTITLITDKNYVLLLQGTLRRRQKK
ncbi:hypothetical protein lbkm_2350 [Lachnospiraceae bacterium KM106-2]|nr:hypothetical protein lbkm_2350 [Lachnospiraceae bacterium KM106-2]